MPTLNANGVGFHYEDSGTGPGTVVFAHGLLWSGRMFDKQVDALKDRFRCVRFDFRGQGQSEITASGYDVDTLTQDAVALIEALDCAPCHFVGLSMGGFVGMRVAIRRPDLLKSLTLLGTTAEPEPAESKGRYRLLNLVARWFGLRLVAGRVMPIMFGRTFLEDPERASERDACRKRLIANHRIAISRAVKGVIERDGVAGQLEKIATPTLIVVGDQDLATPPVLSERLHARIRGSQLVVIPGAGHTSTIEEPGAVNAALSKFLTAVDANADGVALPVV